MGEVGNVTVEPGVMKELKKNVFPGTKMALKIMRGNLS